MKDVILQICVMGQLGFMVGMLAALIVQMFCIRRVNNTTMPTLLIIIAFMLEGLVRLHGVHVGRIAPDTWPFYVVWTAYILGDIGLAWLLVLPYRPGLTDMGRQLRLDKED